MLISLGELVHLIVSISGLQSRQIPSIQRYFNQLLNQSNRRCLVLMNTACLEIAMRSENCVAIDCYKIVVIIANSKHWSLVYSSRLGGDRLCINAILTRAHRNENTCLLQYNSGIRFAYTTFWFS